MLTAWSWLDCLGKAQARQDSAGRTISTPAGGTADLITVDSTPAGEILKTPFAPSGATTGPPMSGRGKCEWLWPISLRPRIWTLEQ